MAPKSDPTSAATANAGGGDASCLRDLQKPGRGEQKGHGTSGLGHPSKFRQASADFERSQEHHEDVSRFQHGKVLFGRPASEHAVASSVRAAAQDRKTRRSRRAW